MQLRYEASTQTIRTVPGNHWVCTVDSWDKAIDPAMIAEQMCDAFNRIHGAKSAPQWPHWKQEADEDTQLPQIANTKRSANCHAARLSIVLADLISTPVSIGA